MKIVQHIIFPTFAVLVIFRIKKLFSEYFSFLSSSHLLCNSDPIVARRRRFVIISVSFTQLFVSSIYERVTRVLILCERFVFWGDRCFRLTLPFAAHHRPQSRSKSFTKERKSFKIKYNIGLQGAQVTRVIIKNSTGEELQQNNSSPDAMTVKCGGIFSTFLKQKVWEKIVTSKNSLENNCHVSHRHKPM